MYKYRLFNNLDLDYLYEYITDICTISIWTKTYPSIEELNQELINAQRRLI